MNPKIYLISAVLLTSCNSEKHTVKNMKTDQATTETEQSASEHIHTDSLLSFTFIELDSPDIIITSDTAQHHTVRIKSAKATVSKNTTLHSSERHTGTDNATKHTESIISDNKTYSRHTTFLPWIGIALAITAAIITLVFTKKK